MKTDCVNERYKRLDRAEEAVKGYAKAVLKAPNRKEAQKCYKDALKLRNDILEELRV